MKKIIYILPQSRPNFTNLFFRKDYSISDCQINQKKVAQIKKRKLIPYVLHKANFIKLLIKNIKVIVWHDHPFSINNSYENFLKKYENFINRKNLYISTFDCYKHLVKNFVPHYPPKFFHIKIKKRLFYK